METRREERRVEERRNDVESRRENERREAERRSSDERRDESERRVDERRNDDRRSNERDDLQVERRFDERRFIDVARLEKDKMSRRDIRLVESDSLLVKPAAADVFDRVSDKVSSPDWISSVSIGLVTAAALAMQHRAVKVA